MTLRELHKLGETYGGMAIESDRGQEPSNLRLHVIRLEDVSVPDLRTWKDHDRYEVEEVTKDELWNRLVGEETDFVYESDRRSDDE